MGSPHTVNRRASGKNLKVHFELPEENSSSCIDDSALGPDDAEKDAHGIDTRESTPLSDYINRSHAPNYQGGLATQSPPTQMMARPGYDPNRIPLTIFAPKPANPVEWSLASNESLFSIHIGNKSGELPRLDECINMPMELPSVEEVVQGKYADMDSHSVSTDTSEEITDFVMEKNYDEIVTSAETAMVMSAKTSKSGTSKGSFQFPVLTGDGGRNSSATVESQRQEPEKPLGPYNPKL